IGRADFNFAETVRSGDDSDKDASDKDDAEDDPDCRFNLGDTGVASISSMAERISVVRAGAESVAVSAAAGTKLGAGSAKPVSCEETDAAAAARACSSLTPPPGMTALCTSTLSSCAGTLSFV